MKEGKIFYRYDGYEKLKADEYICIKETPCGYWIVRKEYREYFDDGRKAPKYIKPRFIYKDARKTFAYPTKELALKSFKIRKEWQIGHLKRQLANATDALYMANAGLVEDKAVYFHEWEEMPKPVKPNPFLKNRDVLQLD